MERKDVTDLDIISIEPRGYNFKYWVFDGIKKIIKYNSPINPDADIMEMLAMNLLKLLKIDTINVTLGENKDANMLQKLGVDDGNCAVIDTFLTDEADIVVNLLYNKWVKVKTNDVQKEISSCFYKMFTIFSNLMNIRADDLENMKRSYIRMVFGDCLIDNEDRRLKNIEAIFNEKTFSYRLAPSFDNSLAFNAYNIGAKEGYCYIGNQAFAVNDLIKYIITHYYKDVEDIIDVLLNLEDIDIVRLLKDYLDVLPKEKVVYIFEYLSDMKTLVNNIILDNNKIKRC